MFRNKGTELLQIDTPIIQAPMAGGVTNSKLVSAVSNHGGLGMIGAGYMNPIQLREQIREIRELTSNPFGVNLFVPAPFSASKEEIEKTINVLKPVREALKLEGENYKIPDYEEECITFDEQLNVVMEEEVPVCSFTFGVPSQETITILKKQNIIVIGTATTVKEAVEIERIGMDMVVVQGSEAGGHRGNFLNNFQESSIGLMSLIPQVVDAVTIPVIAAGGIMDERGLMASLCLGASAVQMGTAFLTTEESGAHPVHKEAILHASEDQMVITRAFSGKPARGMMNQYMAIMQEDEESLPQFPIQNALTQPIRKVAASSNHKEYMSLWAGQSPRLAVSQTVADLMKNVMNEANTLNKRIAATEISK